MGTPDFAVPSLAALIDKGYTIVAVVTAADKPAGRGLKLQHSAVKALALEKGLTVLQPLNLKDPAFLEQLKALSPDLQLVVAFRMLPEQVWNLPPWGTYNLHASLLPKYRGAAPINRAIIAGETETGLTTFKLQHEIDAGSILFQARLPIGADTTAGELHDTMKQRGAELLVKTVEHIEACRQQGKEPVLRAQDLAAVSHAPKIHRDTCRIDWGQPAAAIHNRIRGLSPYPGAFTYYTDEQGRALQFKMLRSVVDPTPDTKSNGHLIDVTEQGLLVACGQNRIRITELQLEGRRKMTVGEFIKGFRFRAGAFFH